MNDRWILVFLFTTSLSFSLDARVWAQSTIASKDAYRQHAEATLGDAQRGKLVFENRERAACIKCHFVNGQRQGVGPDLANIGFKFERDRLIESILEPSKMIADGFSDTLFETDAGLVVHGVLQRVTDGFIELKDAESNTLRLQQSEIVQQKQSTTSLMPANLETTMTLAEFADLIAYLQSLKSTESQAISAVGFMDQPASARRSPQFRSLFREGVVFDHPVAAIPIPNASDQWVVVEQAGRCWHVSSSENATAPHCLLDIRSQVRIGGATGLLGFAFHPRFPEDRRIFLKYQINDKGQIVTIVEERQWNAIDGPTLDRPRELFRIAGSTQDHNGGSLAFGPDKMLYVGMGDSGPQRDPEGHGQDLKTLLGKLLRVDIDHTSELTPYAVPADNPFIGQPLARPEIWALGFREPWRISFDPKTQDLWVGDVGQDRYEEVSIVRKGENMGWNVFEGFSPFSDRYQTSEATYVEPIVSYPRSLGVSVTGGFVYRGKAAPQFQGWYIFGDFESRRIWALRQENRRLVQSVALGLAPSRIVSFGEGLDGELLVVGFDDGIIRRLDLTSADPAPFHREVIAETSEKTPILWKYTRRSPAADWTKPNFDDSQWAVGPAGFGTAGTPGGIIRTDWNSSDIWIRRTFEARRTPKETSRLVLRLHHDEDVEVYLNGVLAARADRWTTGYLEIPISPEARATLHAGLNCIAVHCHQNGGGQFIDVGIVELLDD